MHGDRADRVLVLLPGLADDRLAGPEIRAWEMARALAKTFDVSVAAEVPRETRREGIRVVPHRRLRLLREILRHDVVFASWLPPFALAVARLAGRIAVADLYDPVEFEVQVDRQGAARELRTVRELTRLQLMFADVVTCGADVQVERLEEALAVSMRSDDRPRLVCVPFGVPSPPSSDTHRAGRLRELFEPIAADDVVVLWWGSPWHWLDAETPIHAMNRLSKLAPNVKLVLSVGSPPDPDARRLVRTEEIKDLAEGLGLFGKTVFFLEDWIPYDSRSEILSDADVGITFHRNPLEAAVAVRARYLDFVWCSLPVVLTPGDEFGNELLERGAAIRVDPGDVESAADVLLRLAREPDLRRSATNAAAAVARERQWSTVVAPLAVVLQEMVAGKDRASRLPGALLYGTLRYYLSRMRDKLLVLPSRMVRGAAS